MTDAYGGERPDQVTLLPHDWFLPHEMHDPNRATALAAQIEAHGVWTMPLLVEVSNLVILDGHHRWEAAKRLALAAVPAVLIAYGDPRLSLVSWRERERWSPKDVIARALSGELCPVKTTRHRLQPSLRPIAICLADLRRGESLSLPSTDHRSTPMRHHERDGFARR
jgi:hypothetical protein